MRIGPSGGFYKTVFLSVLDQPAHEGIRRPEVDGLHYRNPLHGSGRQDVVLKCIIQIRLKFSDYNP